MATKTFVPGRAQQTRVSGWKQLQTAAEAARGCHEEATLASRILQSLLEVKHRTSEAGQETAEPRPELCWQLPQQQAGAAPAPTSVTSGLETLSTQTPFFPHSSSFK